MVALLNSITLITYIEDLTRVVISYEIYETTTTNSVIDFSYDRFKLDCIVFKVDIISIENATLSWTSL